MTSELRGVFLSSFNDAYSLEHVLQAPRLLATAVLTRRLLYGKGFGFDLDLDQCQS